jgi:PIN like domain
LKVAFDEHVPAALVRMFSGFAQERQFRRQLSGLEVSSAKDYVPSISDPDYVPNSDAPWIRRFSSAGGRVIISGDQSMMSVPHERLALIEEGMTVIFLGPAWSNAKFFRKCAAVMNWWPSIARTAKTAAQPSFWRVPSTWEEAGDLQALKIEDPKFLKIERQKAAQETVAAARMKRRSRTEKPLPLLDNLLQATSK